MNPKQTELFKRFILPKGEIHLKKLNEIFNKLELYNDYILKSNSCYLNTKDNTIRDYNNEIILTLNSSYIKNYGECFLKKVDSFLINSVLIDKTIFNVGLDHFDLCYIYDQFNEWSKLES